MRFELGRTSSAGTPASLLRRAGSVRVVGEPLGAVRTLGDGRAEIDLRGTTITAPAE